jgi:phosphatidate cytidylyltransferase
MTPDFLKRTLVVVGGVPAFILLLCFPAAGYAAFALLVCAIAFLSGREYQNILKQKWVTEYSRFFPWLCAGLAAMAWLQGFTRWPVLSAGLFLCFILFFVLQFFRANFFESLNTVAAYFLGLFLIAIGLGSITLLLQEPRGLYLVSLLLAVVWIGDILAYIAGLYLFGNRRHKIPSKISPSKSWEGYAGQAVGSMIGAVLVQLLFNGSWTFNFAIFRAESTGPSFPFWSVPLIGLLIGLAAAAGDLAESLLKRSVNIKDSGSILAGHGGVLDRFDSFLFAAPVFYYLVRILAR